MGPCPRGHGGVRNLVSGQSECGGLQWGRARAGTEGLDIETDGTADSYRFNGAVPARARRDTRLRVSENSTLSLNGAVPARARRSRDSSADEGSSALAAVHSFNGAVPARARRGAGQPNASAAMHRVQWGRARAGTEGRGTTTAVRGTTTKLQWGRARAGTEGRAKVASRQAPPRASMGPCPARARRVLIGKCLVARRKSEDLRTPRQSRHGSIQSHQENLVSS